MLVVVRTDTQQPTYRIDNMKKIESITAVVIAAIARSHLKGESTTEIRVPIRADCVREFTIAGTIVSVKPGEKIYFYECDGGLDPKLDRQAQAKFELKVLQLLTGGITEFSSASWPMCPVGNHVRQWTVVKKT